MRYVHPIEQIKEKLHYDPDTGIFTWRTGVTKGKVAGTVEKYLRINFGPVRYQAHRLALYYINNVWSDEEVEHLNGDPLDNKLSNLRYHISNKYEADSDLYNYIKNNLSYDSETGEFKWLKIGKGRYTDSVGVKDSAGYIIIGVGCKTYKAHRLAWFITHKYWPDLLDHINGDRSDNRLCNLRDVTKRQNDQNKISHRNGKLVGTTYCKNSKKWVAQLTVNKKRKHIGIYSTELEAHNAYKNYLIDHNLT